MYRETISFSYFSIKLFYDNLILYLILHLILHFSRDFLRRNYSRGVFLTS